MDSVNFASALRFVFSSRIETDEISTDDAIILLDSLLQVFCTNPQLASSSRRQLTFLHWPRSASSPHLARAAPISGFYHTGQDDETVCVSCGLGLKSWSVRDSVQAQHLKLSPECPFLAALRVFDSKTATIAGDSMQPQSWQMLEAVEGIQQIYNYLRCAELSDLALDSTAQSGLILNDVTPMEAKDSVSNAIGLGHRPSIITLALFLHYYYLSDRKLPQNTIELLKAILQIEEKMEVDITEISSTPFIIRMSENDLPPFHLYIQDIMRRIINSGQNILNDK